ncbi:MAG: hypothetical protein JWN56_1617 [Sphingobacteriales bacterium]|nr:hypothetical protein [Sphingobacteriales bacterium]
MALSYTPQTLHKLEQVLEALQYKVRYDKGNFKTGACIVEKSKIIVINKFSSIESRIISIIELIKTVNAEEHLLNENQKQFLHSFKQTRLEL